MVDPLGFPMPRPSFKGKTYLVTLSPKTAITEACWKTVRGFFQKLRSCKQFAMVLECQTKDKNTGLVVPTKLHLHAYVHCPCGQAKEYLVDELKKIMDAHGHSEKDDGTGSASRHIVHCYKYEDYLNKYDKTIWIHGKDDFDVESFKSDFPNEQQQQELQAFNKGLANVNALSAQFTDLEQDLRERCGDDLSASNVHCYVNWRINVKRDLPPMRDERTELEFVRKLFCYIHNIVEKPQHSDFHRMLDNMLDMQDSGQTPFKRQRTDD